ncbi:hypothetical protein XELAEV_18031318mg, partial [Xenopus laevis]
MSEQDKLSLEQQTSTTTTGKSIINQESEKDEKIQNQHNRRPKSGAKGKLVRSMAVCEESSPNEFEDNFPENQ